MTAGNDLSFNSQAAHIHHVPELLTASQEPVCECAFPPPLRRHRKLTQSASQQRELCLSSWLLKREGQRRSQSPAPQGDGWSGEGHGLSVTAPEAVPLRCCLLLPPAAQALLPLLLLLCRSRRAAASQPDAREPPDHGTSMIFSMSTENAAKVTQPPAIPCHPAAEAEAQRARSVAAARERRVCGKGAARRVEARLPSPAPPR